MATCTRRGAMSHHYVPEPKKTLPIVDRLRLELNRTVRRRVTEAVDAVCVAFEDELTQLPTASTTLPRAVGDYDLFYACCSRLVIFIDNNMDTTPGFLEQMDRLILACHNGATGPTLRSVVTNDLRIRRRDRGNRQKDGKKQVDVKTDPSSTGDSEQPVISPANDTIARAVGDKEEESSDGGVEVAATVGTTSRQWGTRKRLSTSSTRQLRSKRLKQALTSEKVRDTEQSKEAEKKLEGSEEKEKQRTSWRISASQVKAAKLTSRRVRCVRRLEKDFGDVHGNEQTVNEKSGKYEAAGRKETGKIERGRRIRWNLRSQAKNANDSSETNNIDEGVPPPSNMILTGQTQADEEMAEVEGDTTRLEQDINMTMTEKNILCTEAAEIKTTEREGISDDVQVEKNVGLEQLPRGTKHQCDVEMVTKTNDHAEVNGEEENKTDECNKTELEHDVEIANNDVSDADHKGESQQNDCPENGDDPDGDQNARAAQTNGELEVDVVAAQDNTSVVDTSTKQDKQGVDERETEQANVELEDAAAAQASTSVDTSTKQDKQMIVEREIRGKNLILHDQEAECSVNGANDALPESHIGRNGSKHPVAADTPFAVATSLPSAEGGQKAAHVSDQDDASFESDHEPPVPGLCDAGMRPHQQVSHFKACLRKSIRFVDALLCKPPPGKSCNGDCKKIRSRQCKEGVPCRDPLCRNWHKAEAHTDRCKNPLCEFKTRILLREIMHQVANQDMQTQLLVSQWEEKSMELIVATKSEQCTLEQLKRLNDDIGQLDRSIDDAKEETESLKNTRRVLLANLSAIGVKPQDDVVDGFPDFEAHYK